MASGIIKAIQSILSIAKGGTGASTVAGAQTNLGLVPTQTRDKTSSGFVADARVIKDIDGQIISKNWSPTSGSETILSYVTSQDTNYLPFSFVKCAPSGGGTVVPADSPISDNEFTGFVTGNDRRLRVVIKPYKSANNNIEYSRDIWCDKGATPQDIRWLESGWDSSNTWRPYAVKNYHLDWSPDYAEGVYVHLSANQFVDDNNNALSTPSGYEPFTISYLYPGNSNLLLIGFDAGATGTSDILHFKTFSAIRVTSPIQTRITIKYLKV